MTCVDHRHSIFTWKLNSFTTPLPPRQVSPLIFKLWHILYSLERKTACFAHVSSENLKDSSTELLHVFLKNGNILLLHIRYTSICETYYFTQSISGRLNASAFPGWWEGLLWSRVWGMRVRDHLPGISSLFFGRMCECWTCSGFCSRLTLFCSFLQLFLCCCFL